MSQFHQANKRIVAVDCTGDLRHNGGETKSPFGGSSMTAGVPGRVWVGLLLKCAGLLQTRPTALNPLKSPIPRAR